MLKEVYLFIDKSIKSLEKNKFMHDLNRISKHLTSEELTITLISTESALLIDEYMKYHNICTDVPVLPAMKHNSGNHTGDIMNILNIQQKKSADIFSAYNISSANSILISDSQTTLERAKKNHVACIGFTLAGEDMTLHDTDYIVEDLEGIDLFFLQLVYQRSHNEAVTIGRTDRILLRELSQTDIPDLYRICQSENIKKYIHNEYLALPDALEKHKAYIEHVYRFFNYGFWGIYLIESDKLIGRCGLQNLVLDDIAEVELGYLLDVNYQGYGYASESAEIALSYGFHALELPRIVALIEPDNTPSLLLAEHIGMHYIKTVQRESIICSLYQITAQQYFSHHS